MHTSFMIYIHWDLYDSFLHLPRFHYDLKKDQSMQRNQYVYAFLDGAIMYSFNTYIKYITASCLHCLRFSAISKEYISSIGLKYG